MSADDIESQWQQITDDEKEDEYKARTLGKLITLSGDGPVTSDWHIPLTDYEEAGRCVATASRMGLGSWFVIAGDLFHQDSTSFHFPKQDSARFEREHRLANACVRRLLQNFDRVYVTRGNHDEKFEKRLEYAATFQRTIHMILSELSASERKRVIVTDRDHLIIETEEGPWRACHTKNYSKAPLSYPAKLADVHRMNVAAGHRHHLALGFSPSGYRVAELGGLFDREKTEYLHRWTTDFPHWQSGWMILRNGRMICPGLTGQD